ncbi:MAG: carboxylase, partial [Alistipes sp.]|nr:carboxylase [Alistipes sp.]
MAKKLKIRDLTLRDGQQSSFATRMTQEQIDRCLPYYKDANFYAMEVWGGAVPDSVMRYLNENPWTRLESIHQAVGNVSKLTALSRGRNLFGYSPYTDEIIDGFCRNAIQSGLGIMRIFDALNDVDNVKSTIKYVKQYGGIADCAVCYTVDPKYPEPNLFLKLLGKKKPAPVFTDAYFLDKAKQMAALGADMITIKDMSGLIPPRRVATLVKLFKQHLSIPVDFHTHCTPGYGLASVLAAIVAGVDIVDTNCWYFGGGTGAPAIELVHVFCQKLGIDTGVNMEAVAKINTQLREIRKELNRSVFGTEKPEPKPFNPLTDKLPADIDALFDEAIRAAKANDEQATIDACRKIEAHFGFPAPNELVQKAEIPGGMYSNMVAQLQQLKAEEILPRAMELIPSVRLAAGLPPLVTPTSQIVGAQAVNCALDEKAGRPMYTNKSSQFVGLVKGEYGKTPVKIDPEFRFKICGVREETPYDTSKYQMQPNPELPEAGGAKLAATEKEVLLLELFPMVAKKFLTDLKVKAYELLKP